jgi:hypothetical protein
MRFRNLRIAWSVAWGLLAVLLIVLWVRSSSEPTTVKKTTTSVPVTQQFRDIPEGLRQSPTLGIEEPKNITLDVYLERFDEEPIENRSLSIAEWNELKTILGKGIEVENTALLALSAVIRFLDDDNEPTYRLTLFWTSDTGDVYFETKERWFKVSDRKAVRNVLRTNLK